MKKLMTLVMLLFFCLTIKCSAKEWVDKKYNFSLRKVITVRYEIDEKFNNDVIAEITKKVFAESMETDIIPKFQNKGYTISTDSETQNSKLLVLIKLKSCKTEPGIKKGFTVPMYVNRTASVNGNSYGSGGVSSNSSTIHYTERNDIIIPDSKTMYSTVNVSYNVKDIVTNENVFLLDDIQSREGKDFEKVFVKSLKSFWKKLGKYYN